MTYRVMVPGSEQVYASFEDALQAAKAIRLAWPRHPVYIQNDDRIDFEDNGLTPEEEVRILEEL